MARPAKQIGALPWRERKGRIEFLLITSRETQRWVIPKGWPMDGVSDMNAARREAFEEAGIEGRMRRKPVGSYNYIKRGVAGNSECRVTVYALHVDAKLKKWPERKERKRQWFSLEDAAWHVDEQGLKDIIRTFI